MSGVATFASGSLAGLRVVEIGTSVAAPMAGQILGDLGADVVKVERLGTGDDSRSWAPPHWDGESVTFLALNRNKQSLAIDFKDPRGHRIVEDLLRKADVLVHNLRPGTLASSGFDPETLRALNPRLINCEITGFGPTGPRAGQSAYDPLLQAYSGIVSLTGQQGGPPSRVPVSLLDIGTAMWTVLGIYEGLRRRDLTGEGCHVEFSLLQTALTWMSVPALTVMAGAPAPTRMGSGFPGVVPYGAYPASDGDVFVSAGNDQLWRRLCAALDAPDLVETEGFGSNGDRVQNRARVDHELGLVTSRFGTADILRRLEAARVPCAPVQTMEQVVQDPQVTALGVISRLPHEQVEDFRVVNLPMTFDGAYPAHRKAPPALGADTDDVLSELGRSAGEISELERDSVIQRRSPVATPSGEEA